MTDPALTFRDLLIAARRALAEAGIAEHALEGELLVQHVFGLDAARLFAALDDPAPQDAWQRLKEPLERRAAREPLAYITGTRAFYGRNFYVTPDVLIPRHETELLVELAVAFGQGTAEGEPLRVADIGTGSGILAVTLALELPGAAVEAVDVSGAALAVAQRNAVRYGVADRIAFRQGDLTSPISGRFDIVVANLPYVRPDTLAAAEPEVRREPSPALLGGPDGLDIVRRLIAALPDVLRPDSGVALLEVDPLTARGAVEAAEEALPAASVAVRRDLAGLERCVEIRTA